MGFVAIDPKKLAAANRWANLIRVKQRRDYAFAYLAWLRNGGEGMEPDRGRTSAPVAESIRARIGEFKLWEDVR